MGELFEHVWVKYLTRDTTAQNMLAGMHLVRLPDNLSEAQLDGRACIRCDDEHSAKRPVEAWSAQSSQLFECIDSEACCERRTSASGGARG